MNWPDIDFPGNHLHLAPERHDERKWERMRRFLAISAAASMALVFATTAVAAKPTDRVYGTVGGAIQRELQTPSRDQPGRLPFTGLDLGLLGGGGVVLLLVGGSLWRLGRDKA